MGTLKLDNPNLIGFMIVANLVSEELDRGESVPEMNLRSEIGDSRLLRKFEIRFVFCFARDSLDFDRKAFDQHCQGNNITTPVQPIPTTLKSIELLLA